jgi:hypothetical protein
LLDCFRVNTAFLENGLGVSEDDRSRGSLTDYALALEGVVFIVLLQRGRAFPSRLRTWLTLFFASMSVASICGGMVHGFFLEDRTLGNMILWPTTLLAIGVTTFSIWAIGAYLLDRQGLARWVFVAAGIQLAIYCAVILFLARDFWVAVADNLPAVVFLLLVLGLAYRREKQTSLLLAALGAILTVFAALLQQQRVGFHPVYFNHNALYHVLQAIALLLFFLGGYWMLAATNERTEGRRNLLKRMEPICETSKGDCYADTP